MEDGGWRMYSCSWVYIDTRLGWWHGSEGVLWSMVDGCVRFGVADPMDDGWQAGRQAMDSGYEVVDLPACRTAGTGLKLGARCLAGEHRFLFVIVV
ncbi:unnamed protein product [Anisakis simplex]|uniref:RNase H domain-containing protein n=1 Tax=Anisakis simplex TaxID=6269 RepID=A0A0M3JM25_ANISI|nr:unnamed protein product [Anisakis simplex]